MTKRLISVEQMAEKIGCSHPTVWRRVQDGTLPRPIKIGHLTRWVEEEVDERFTAMAEGGEAA